MKKMRNNGYRRFAIICIAASALFLLFLTYLLYIPRHRVDVCSLPYGFIFDMEQDVDSLDDTPIYEGVVSFCDRKTNTFAAFGHPVFTGGELPQEALVMSLVGNNAGRIVGEVHQNNVTGCSGTFAAGFEPAAYSAMYVAPRRRVRTGDAELLVFENGGWVTYNGQLSFSDDELFPLSFNATYREFSGLGTGSSGCAILQNGMVAAVVCGGTEEADAKNLLCVFAEDMARMMYVER